MKNPTLICTFILTIITAPSLYAQQPGGNSEAALNVSGLLILGGIFLFLRKEYSKKMNPQNRMLFTVAAIIIFLVLLTFQFAKAQGPNTLIMASNNSDKILIIKE